MASKAIPATFESTMNDELGGSGSAAPVGRTPVSAADPEEEPAHSQKSARVRRARRAGTEREGPSAAPSRAGRECRGRRARSPRRRRVARSNHSRRGLRRRRRQVFETQLRRSRRSSPRALRLRGRAGPDGARKARRSGPGHRADAASRVVSEIAATPSATNGACSSAAKGMPRSTSCVEDEGDRRRLPGLFRDARGSRPDEGPGGRMLDPSPASAMRGRPSGTEIVEDDRGKRLPGMCGRSCEVDRAGSAVRSCIGRDENERPVGERRRAPLPAERTPRELDERRRSRRVVSVPLCPRPLLSRWATRTMASSERPGITVTMFRSSTSPRSTRSVLHTSSSVSSPSPAIVSEYQRAAFEAPSVPGTRDGNSVESSLRDRDRGRRVEHGLERRAGQGPGCRK